MDAEEFIALITQHIPEKSFQLVRYYGFYSNRSRGERRKEAERETDHDSTATPEEVEVIDVSSYKPPRLPSKTWRECIKKVSFFGTASSIASQEEAILSFACQQINLATTNPFLYSVRDWAVKLD